MEEHSLCKTRRVAPTARAFGSCKHPTEQLNSVLIHKTEAWGTSELHASPLPRAGWRNSQGVHLPGNPQETYSGGSGSTRGLEAEGEMLNSHDLLIYWQSNGITLFLLSVVV